MTSDYAQKFLESLERFDLAMLVSQCDVELSEDEVDGGWGNPLELIVSAVVRAPSPIGEALKKLPLPDRKRIAEAIASHYPDRAAPDDIHVEFRNGVFAQGTAALLAELLIHREMMISVATGGDRIQDVDDYYRAREGRIKRTLPEGAEYENPHGDLWAWYQHWSTSLQKYHERRQYVRRLFGPAIAFICSRPKLPLPTREPTGWDRVDRALARARGQLETSSVEEEFQAIGLLCREAMISLAQAVYDPKVHQTLDGVAPSDTDAKRMLEATIAHVFPGESNKEVRAHARASLALTLNLQHRRTATRQLAALCVEATASTAAVISIIARPQL
jgi:hypothetical protein